MKLCTRCKKRLPLSQFGYRSGRKDGKQNYCIPCGRAYHREYYARHKTDYCLRRNAGAAHRRDANRSKVLQYLAAHGCVDCPEKDPVVLDFDHVRGKKLGNIATMVASGVSWGRIEAEIAKCDVRCANCHRRRTAKVRGWYRTKIAS